MTLQEFHEAWAYAKEHPEECTDGYNKAAFMYVQFWLDKLARKKTIPFHDLAQTDPATYNQHI